MPWPPPPSKRKPSVSAGKRENRGLTKSTPITGRPVVSVAAFDSAEAVGVNASASRPKTPFGSSISAHSWEVGSPLIKNGRPFLLPITGNGRFSRLFAHFYGRESSEPAKGRYVQTGRIVPEMGGEMGRNVPAFALIPAAPVQSAKTDKRKGGNCAKDTASGGRSQ